MKEFYRVSIGGQALVPAAAVIPARKAYVKVAAVKTLVVGHREKLCRRSSIVSVDVFLYTPFLRRAL